MKKFLIFFLIINFFYSIPVGCLECLNMTKLCMGLTGLVFGSLMLSMSNECLLADSCKPANYQDYYLSRISAGVVTCISGLLLCYSLGEIIREANNINDDNINDNINNV